jgi:hypothetical protein
LRLQLARVPCCTRPRRPGVVVVDEADGAFALVDVALHEVSRCKRRTVLERAVTIEGYLRARSPRLATRSHLPLLKLSARCKSFRSRSPGRLVPSALVTDQLAPRVHAVERTLHVEGYEGQDSLGPSRFIYLLDQQVESLFCRPVWLPTKVVFWQQSVCLSKIGQPSRNHCLESFADRLQQRYRSVRLGPRVVWLVWFTQDDDLGCAPPLCYVLQVK